VRRAVGGGVNSALLCVIVRSMTPDNDALADLGVVSIANLPGDSRLHAAFPKLTSEQIKALEPFGERRQLRKGEVVWQAGTIELCMYVVIDGRLRVVNPRTGEEIVTHGPGSFSGDIEVLSGRSVLLSGVAETDLELLQIPADCVRSIVSERPEIGQMILSAYLTRRAMIVESTSAGVLVIGSRFSAETLHIREFLARNLYPIVWEDLEVSEEAAHVLAEFGIREDETPVVVLPSGDVLRSPTIDALAQALGVKKHVDEKLYDLVIVGAGPAGLAAAVYGASEGLSTLVLDSSAPGGQAGKSSMIENYMGFPLGVSGQELADSAVVQAEKFGAELMVPADVQSITCRSAGVHEIRYDDEVVQCRSIILAPGAQYRKLDFEDSDRFDGRGVYYEATHVERVMCADRPVAIIGGGNSAGQAAVFLAENSQKVFLVLLEDTLREHMSSYLARRIEQSKNIETLLHSEVCEIHGEESLHSITICDRKTKEARQEEVAGLFVLIGAAPKTDWLPSSIATDERGYILTGVDVPNGGNWPLPRHPFFLETSCPGVFAAGDARANSVKRVASAVGEGAMAVTFVHQHLADAASRPLAKKKEHAKAR